jgi:hypothetical protein
MSDLLFDNLPVQAKPETGNHCNDCEYIEKWQCGGKFFFYCGKRKDRKTLNGKKKVLCKTPACYLFEAKPGKEKA